MSEKETKTQYRIRNWSQYNAALKQRGSLTFWVDEEVLAVWLNDEKTGNRGASPTYSDKRDRDDEYNGFSVQFSWTPNTRIDRVFI